MPPFEQNQLDKFYNWLIELRCVHEISRNKNDIEIMTKKMIKTSHFTAVEILICYFELQTKSKMWWFHVGPEKIHKNNKIQWWGKTPVNATDFAVLLVSSTELQISKLHIGIILNLIILTDSLTDWLIVCLTDWVVGWATCNQHFTLFCNSHSVFIFVFITFTIFLYACFRLSTLFLSLSLFSIKFCIWCVNGSLY